MSEAKDLQAEITLLRDENAALLRLLEAQETTLAQESKHLADALKLLSQEQQHLYKQLQQNAEYDPLTGLPNRASLTIYLDRAHQAAILAPNYRFAVLWIDLDRLEQVNETMGRLAGNQLLQGVADRLKACLRTTDMVAKFSTEPTIARVAGDEFAVLLNDIGAVEHATQVCDRIQEALNLPFVIDNTEIFSTASIGIALSAATYRSSDDILRDAAMAMRRAKVLGKARSQLFDAEMRASALVRWELETDLRRALEQNELRVFYQAKVDVRSRQIAGFEALVRWEHPKRGLISPLQFIPIAEETGLIIPIGNWVLREACRQIREWNATLQLEPELRISVNLSCCQFADSSLFESIAEVLRETSLAAPLLSLEVTESNLMGNTAFAIEVLKKLQALGVGLMIDDFGTGYSSLSYLAQFPFDTLKIDQSFVRVMEKEQDSTEMVRTMIVLASNLGMQVVAEGVETEEQFKKLEALNCDYAQGYLFSKPLPAPKIKEMLMELVTSGEHAFRS